MANFSWQEYYADKSIRKVYQDVIEQLLSTIVNDDAEDNLKKITNDFVHQDDSGNAWPPWPWPPWGDDDDDEIPNPNKPESAHELAKKVLKFEGQIANATLDMCVSTSSFC